MFMFFFGLSHNICGYKLIIYCVIDWLYYLSTLFVVLICCYYCLSIIVVIIKML